MIYLYYFSQYSLPDEQGDIVAEWAQTPYEEPISGVDGYPGVTFLPTPALTHGDISYSSEDSSGTAKLTVARDHPIAVKFLAGYPAGSIYLRVLELDEPGGFASMYWRGIVRSASHSELTAELTCTRGNERLARQIIPILNGTTCQWVLFQPLNQDRGCGLDRAAFTRTGTVTDISSDGLTLTTTLSEADNWFAPGVVEVAGHRQMCVASTGGVLHLFAAVPGVAIGMPISAERGCDGSGNSCKSFGNYTRFSGDELPDPKNFYAEGVA